MAYEDTQAPNSGNWTAFRAAEKKYQLQRAQRTKDGKRKQLSAAVAETDFLRDVLDFRADAPRAAESCAGAISSSDGIGCSWAWPGQRMHTLAAHPGMAVLPGALTAAEQRRVVRDALTAFPEPPNATNHTAHLGQLPSLWDASLRGLHLRADADRPQRGGVAAHQDVGRPKSARDAPRSACASSLDVRTGQHRGCLAATRADEGAAVPSGSSQPPALADDAGYRSTHAAEAHWTAGGNGPPATDLLRRLRWATLGPQYDWTRRRYGPAAAALPLPRYLRYIALRAAAAAARVTRDAAGSECSVGANAAAAAFEPNAALVNYYSGEGDTLCGHKDDAERALEQPLVSLSVGCDAIFLIGGAHRDVPPTALLLRSGDVLVMAGPARTSFHGVPRVLLSRPAEGLRTGDSTSADSKRSAAAEDAPPLDAAMAEYMSRARINVSVRQVAGCRSTHQDA